MKKLRPLFFIFFLFPILIHGQVDCEKNIKEANIILLKKSPFSEQNELFALIEPCALQGNAQAENYLGMFYLNGIKIEKDTNRAFTFISQSAHQNYPEAQYNLGRMYKFGIGCEIDFEKAIKWFEKATKNGNQKAGYSLGYMYFKGYGVEQDYQKAVYWFKRSTDVMAIHFLGLCYYLGYGVSADENKALELLINNNTLNSKTLAANIKAQKKEKNKLALEEALQSNLETDSTYVQPKVISEITNEVYEVPLIKEDVKGGWIGKLIQYDWSGKIIERIAPISINFEVKEDYIAIETLFGDQVNTNKAQLEDGNLYMQNDLKFTLDRIYPENPNELSLNYSVFTLSLQKKELFGNTYLTGSVDTFIDSWTEYGPPMSVVLRPKDSEDALDAETVEALASQEDQFIKLYPVPFNNSLTIQYQLETPSEVIVELVGLHDTSQRIILPTEMQQEGGYSYTIPVNSSLPAGYYVVRLTAGSQLYTRLILKNN